FTNDPLLQGRNFSYLDTQLKRLGSPNFTYLPVNAPKCPMAHFQQDGHMAVSNPVTRANYEPNSWSAEAGGPREDPAEGFRSYPDAESGGKRRLRPESFADHYSQARQFYVSQTEVERRHIGDAFTFELSKCDQARIRSRMVAGLRNVDEDLARYVAGGLGLKEFPDPAPAAHETHRDLPASPVLSIAENGPDSFAGRKVGVLATGGADATVLNALRAAVDDEQANLEFVAPEIGGFEASDGSWVEADQKIGGGPSVLYDAVVVLVSAEGVTALARDSAARDFVTDAYAHCKFVGYTAAAMPLLAAAGVGDLMDDGFADLSADGKNAAAFVEKCRQLRFWARKAEA
ncbi:MAG: catalase-related domain-containing protein, partial [Streptosporangiaceae bacterium]